MAVMVSPVVMPRVLGPVVKVQVEAVPRRAKVPRPRSVLVVVSKKSTLPAVGAMLPPVTVTAAVNVTGVPYGAEGRELLTIVVVGLAVTVSVTVPRLPLKPLPGE